MRNSMRTGAVLAGSLMAWGLTIGPATAAPGGWEPQHAEWGETIENFCDVPGLTVEDAGSGDGLARTVVRGGLQYHEGRSLDTDVYTNLANGRSVSILDKRNDRDVHVTDNGDGTLTVLYLASGTNTVYDDAGDVIARSAGSVMVEAVWDHAGTVTDRSDDEPVSFTFLRSSGSDYDFCGVLLPALS